MTKVTSYWLSYERPVSCDLSLESYLSRYSTVYKHNVLCRTLSKFKFYPCRNRLIYDLQGIHGISVVSIEMVWNHLCKRIVKDSVNHQGFVLQDRRSVSRTQRTDPENRRRRDPLSWGRDTWREGWRVYWSRPLIEGEVSPDPRSLSYTSTQMKSP